MLSWIRAQNDKSRKATELYGAVVAQARSPRFYDGLGVPDTLAGRYEMIVAVLFQVLERLKGQPGEVDEVARKALESLFTDVDDQMREIGIGDLSVPRKVKRAAAGFYERSLAYRAALDAGDEAALAAALARFIDTAGGDPAAADVARRLPLARHMLAQRDRLSVAALDDVLAGRAFVAPVA
ncbi:MAG: ubiquinol-cytochrome C chaperone family protein [Hyphomicrobiaceae bacterium]